jgi:hypothetical protein
LLDTARARTDLRADALAFAGPRAVWLAGLSPEWRYVLRAPATDPGRSAPVPVHGRTAEDEAADRRVWEEGLFAERTALLARLRAHHPAYALELLRSTWSSERAEDRLLFLDTLRAGIGPADEPFLDQALTDRSRNVRAAAAELLSALPGSALGARMAERATRCVRLADDGEGGRVVVTAPDACDAAMERDGVVPVPPSGRGERAWWLGQLVEATPLTGWEAAFGGLPPERIVALPVSEGWQGDLHAAWSRAAVRQRDERWARALLGPAGGEGGAASADPAKLLSVLPEGERAAWVAGFVAAHGLSEAFQALAVCAVPWPRELGRAVVDALDIARDAGSYPWSFSGVMGLAERCLDPAEAEEAAPLTALAASADPAPGNGAAEPVPGAAGYWTEAFQRLVGTLRLRAAMLAELAEPAAAPAEPA